MYGIYFNMPEDEYHAQEGLSSTGIKEMLQSPTNFWFNSVYNLNYKPKKPTVLRMARCSIVCIWRAEKLLKSVI